MKLVRDRYSDELPVPLSEFERAQLFRRVEAALDTRPRRWRPFAAGALVLATLCAAMALGWRHRTGPVEAAPVVVAPTLPRESLELPDGSRALLDPAAQLRVDAAEPLRVRLTLLEGGASFQVAEVEGRSFVVSAGAVDVNVLGGAVAVVVAPLVAGAGDAAVDVQVMRGRVGVHRKSGSAPVMLETGERWSNALAARSP